MQRDGKQDKVQWFAPLLRFLEILDLNLGKNTDIDILRSFHQSLQAIWQYFKICQYRLPPNSSAITVPFDNI
jgi:hypothetical protein